MTYTTYTYYIILAKQMKTYSTRNFRKNSNTASKDSEDVAYSHSSINFVSPLINHHSASFIKISIGLFEEKDSKRNIDSVRVIVDDGISNIDFGILSDDISALLLFKHI